MKPKRVKINDTVYPSMNQAAKVIGVSEKTIRNRIESAHFPEYVSLDQPERNNIYKKKWQARKRPVIAYGKWYPSITEAGAWNMLSEPAAKHRCDSNTDYCRNWNYADL